MLNVEKVKKRTIKNGTNSENFPPLAYANTTARNSTRLRFPMKILTSDYSTSFRVLVALPRYRDFLDSGAINGAYLRNINATRRKRVESADERCARTHGSACRKWRQQRGTGRSSGNKSARTVR